MIQIYPKGQSDFSMAGITLHPTQGAVNYQDNGRYDMDLTMPFDSRVEIDYGMVVRCPVPAQEIGEITLGTVECYEVTSGLTDVPIYSVAPHQQSVSYTPWAALRSYSAGDKRSYDNKNYRCTTGHGGLSTPPPDNPTLWTEISRYTTVSTILVLKQGGDKIVKTGDYTDTYMKVADTAGHEGFIEIAKCTDLSETETRTVAAQSIREQSFTITEIEKSSDGMTLTIHGEHVSYQLGRTMLGDCNISRATPATALLLIRGAMKEAYPGEVETNLTEEDALITGDFSWKNAQAAVLDPKSGLLQATNGKIIRNDMNVYIITEPEAVPRYRITYGTNMKAVKWDGNTDELITRVYPIAQHEDGSTMLLPEEYIDSVRNVPYMRPEALNTGLKVGAKEKQEDGSEIELDEATVLARMREAASNRFNIDECDKIVITLDVDWLHLPDTEEYKQYAALMNAAPGEWVEVLNAPLGISTVIQLTGYTFDPILCRYTKGTFGKKKQSPGVAGYNIKSGAVGSRALAPNSVGSQNIQADSITAREIEAGSITADKIASREITAELIQANTITANEIAAGTITANEIDAHTITADQIEAHTITAGEIDAQSVRAAVISAGLITAEDILASSVRAAIIAAGKISADDINAQSVRAALISAGKITADDIQTGTLTAALIDTTDLQAINATLGTATIARAEIASADIDYLQVKDLDAQSAFFGQTVIQEGVANKLFIPRLSVDYAQIVSATIGDLVIQASNGNYYRLDVDLDGDVTATQMTPTAEEIEQGYTEDGRTIYMGTDITASDLNTTNIYASHALMDEITANIINVDKLFAREATISKINALDLSSNTYIQATIGSWQSGSTITQTINSINTRISTLGYGTFFYSETEPSHENLVIGDVWIQPVDDHTWDEIAEYTWDELSSWTWDQVAGEYRMYVWTGEKFKLLYDNLIISELQTQINQNAYAITLKADQSAVNTLSGEVTQFAAVLEVQAQEIQSAVSAVTSKTANYTGLDDPSQDPQISLSPGDTWTKTAGDGTWGALEDYTWDELAALTWDELAGASVYTWTGTEWLQTSDYGAIVQSRTIIDQTSEQVTVLAQQNEMTQAGLLVIRTELSVTAEEIRAEAVRAQGAELQLNASISLTAERIQQEVERATLAEGGKIDKTVQYQTADAIVSEAVRLAASSASDNYIAKTTVYQTAESILLAAEAYTKGYAYAIRSGIAIVAEGIEISGATYIKIKSGGKFLVDSGNFAIDDSGNVTIWGTIHSTIGDIGGFTLANNSLSSGSGATYMNLNSNASNTYAIWVGNETAASAPFRLKRSGALSLTKLLAIAEDNTETEVNLRTVGLWKLNYSTVKSVDQNAGTMTLSNGTVVNFIRASSLSVQPDGAGNVGVYKSGSLIRGTLKSVTAGYNSGVAPTYNASTGLITLSVKIRLAGTQEVNTSSISVSGALAYNAGYNKAISDATLVTRYTRTAGTYGGEGTTHYVSDSGGVLMRVRAVGSGWYTTQSANAYTLPTPKT